MRGVDSPDLRVIATGDTVVANVPHVDYPFGGSALPIPGAYRVKKSVNPGPYARFEREQCGVML